MSSYNYNVFTGELDLVGSGSSYIDGVVATPADLPVTVGTPALDSVYLAKAGSGVWLINRKPAGLYCRTANDGDLDDWQYLGAFPEVNADGNWELYNSTDPTKELKFDVSGVSTGTTRTLTVPDASGTISLIGHTHTATAISDATNAGRALLTASTVAAQRTALELGSAATKNVGAGSAEVAAGDHTHSGVYATASHTHELADLSATGAASGKVLTSDGDGTASWQDAAAGSGEVRSDVSGSYTYTGLAAANTAESTASWTIRRSEFTSAGAYVATLTATNVKWDDRLTASYS